MKTKQLELFAAVRKTKRISTYRQRWWKQKHPGEWINYIHESWLWKTKILIGIINNYEMLRANNAKTKKTNMEQIRQQIRGKRTTTVRKMRSMHKP